MRQQVKQVNFDNQEVYAALDVHKKQWKVSIGLKQTRLRSFSQDPNPVQLYEHLQRKFPGGKYICAYEAGFCGFWIAEKFRDLGVDCLVLHSSDIPSTDKERRQKTDKRDSLKILKLLQSGHAQSIYIPSKAQQAVRSLVREREGIIKHTRSVKNRIKAKLLFYGIKIPTAYSGCCWSRNFIKWLISCADQPTLASAGLSYLIEYLEFLRSMNLKMTKQIRQIGKTDNYIRPVELLTSIPGIGVLTAMKYLSELGSINRFTTLDQHASFIGLVPNMYSSGESERTGGMTKRGNAIVKSALIESAWIAKRCDPALALKYEELVKRMKPSKAIVIIAKKLLNRIRFVLKNDQLYEKGIK